MERLLFRIAPKTSTTIEALHARLVPAGFARTLDEIGHDNHLTEWTTGDQSAVVFYMASATTGGSMLAINAEEPANLTRLIGDDLALEPFAAFMSRFDAKADIASLIFALGEMRLIGKLLLSADPAVLRVVDALVDDPRRAVRVALIEVCDSLLWPELDAPFARLLALEPAFAGYAATREKRMAERRDGTLNDTETDDLDTLIDRAKRGLRDGQLERVRRAAKMILDDDPESHHGHGYRGIAALRDQQLADALIDLEIAVGLSAKYPQWNAYWQQHADEVRAQLTARPVAITVGDRDLLFSVVTEHLSRQDATLEVMIRELQKFMAAPDPIVTFFAGEVARHRSQYATAIKAWRAVRDAFPRSLYAAIAYHHLVERYPDQDYEPSYDQYGYPTKPKDLRTRNDAEIAETARAVLEVEARLGRTDPLSAEEQIIASYYAGHYNRWTERSVVVWLAELAYEAKHYDRALGYCARVLAEEKHDHALYRGAMLRAQSLTGLLRHADAVDAYAEAIDAVRALKSSGEVIWSTDPRGQLYFNRACELSKLGRRDQALRDLRQALSYDHKWIEAAKTDDYFAPLHRDAAFVSLLAQPPTVRDDDEPEIVDVAAAEKELLRHLWNSAYREARPVGLALVRHAEETGDAALLVRTQTKLGTAFAYGGDLDEGLRRAQAAVDLGATALSTAPADRVEPIHMLGAIHHARGEHALARQRYEEALALRTATEGPDSIAHAKSFGDLARLAVDLADLDEAIAWTERGRTLLSAAIERLPSDHDDWFEAVFDLASIESNMAMTLASTTRHAEAVDAFERSVRGFVRFAAADRRVPVPFIERTLHRMQALLGNPSVDAALLARADAAQAELAALHPDNDDPPVVRAEKLFWKRLSAALRAEVANGRSEPEIGALLHAMTRDGQGVPPSLQALMPELARRIARGGFLVTSAMAIQMLETGAQSLDETLRTLTDIGVGHAFEEAG